MPIKYWLNRIFWPINRASKILITSKTEFVNTSITPTKTTHWASYLLFSFCSEISQSTILRTRMRRDPTNRFHHHASTPCCCNMVCNKELFLNYYTTSHNSTHRTSNPCQIISTIRCLPQCELHKYTLTDRQEISYLQMQNRSELGTFFDLATMTLRSVSSYYMIYLLA